MNKVDLKIIDRNGEFVFDPTSPFVLNEKTTVQQYELIIRKDLDLVVSKYDSAEIKGPILAAIASVNQKCKIFENFKTSSLKKLDIGDKKEYVTIIIEVIVGNSESEVTINA